MRIGRSGVAVLVCVAVSAGLGACGDDDSDTAEPAATETTADVPATTAPAETTAEPAPSDDGDGGGATTKPGTELKVGETAHVTIKPLTATTSMKTYPLDVTALKIEKGDIDDLKDVNLPAAQKTATPYYVTVRVESTAGTVPVKGSDPDIRFDGIDDRGQEQGSVTFIGDFERCDDKTAPDPFTQGKSYESCLAYLVPRGASITEVRWTGSDEYVLKPVVWK